MWEIFKPVRLDCFFQKLDLDTLGLKEAEAQNILARSTREHSPLGKDNCTAGLHLSKTGTDQRRKNYFISI